MRGTRNPEISRPHTLVSQTGQALHKHRLKVKHKMLNYWNTLDFAILKFWATFWVEYNPHRTLLEVGFASPAVPELLTRLLCWEGKETIRPGTVLRHLCFLCKENVTKKRLDLTADFLMRNPKSRLTHASLAFLCSWLWLGSRSFARQCHTPTRRRKASFSPHPWCCIHNIYQ